MTMISGLVSGRRRATSTASSRGSNDDGNTGIDDDTQVMEPDQGNVLSHLISQLRPGADLSRVTLPTFILEPRSMLERITNFMCHPELLLSIPDIDDPVERFVSVVKFYLSGWHIRPPGVKKPLNPILGEIFTCYWDLPDQTRAYYISEQTSHHPPKSSYFYLVPDHHIRVDGCLKPRSKFLGNSAASLMEGTTVLTFLNRGQDPKKGERYHLTQPNMYARGILFGKMKYELGDHSVVRCPETGLVADLEFKTKGWVGGTYNAIGGTVKNEKTGEMLYEFSGLWSDEMFVKDLKTGHKEMFFNAHRSRPSPPQVRPLDEQEDRESQKLWYKTAQAVKDRNHELATDEKTKIEDAQRDEAAKRAQDGVEWHPRLFRRVKGGPGGPEEGEEDLEWIINAQIDGHDPKQLTEQVLAIYPILAGQKSSSIDIPSRQAETKSAAAPDPAKSAHDDLIDFGQDNTPAQPPQPQRPVAPLHSHVESTGEISGLLQSTGKPAADGPLLDFHHDLQKTVPDIRRSDTTGSTEAFVDAKE
ncbi:Oxysterol-binding protein OBPa [Gnomoniopsis sp. IMI 355080]|nr:Oxysterol-binding protein OBPa [Gnomoniopsis sp. IMI 355080]